jgi:hypothetical protein
MTYLVLQVFAANARNEAEEAQAFLKQHGLPTILEPMRQGKWRITTAEGANARTAEGTARLNELALTARQIGDAYARAGGRYRFHKPYPWTYSP